MSIDTSAVEPAPVAGPPQDGVGQPPSRENRSTPSSQLSLRWSNATHDEFYSDKLNELLAACRKNLRSLDEELVIRAFRLCYEAHKNDRRASGEPYFVHPFEVSMIVAQEIPLDDISIVAALLHDVVEDTAYRLDEIREEFGN